jgi:hypothetical protein
MTTIIIIQAVCIVFLVRALRKKVRCDGDEYSEWEDARQAAVDDFDFAKSVRVMKYLGWKWEGQEGMRVPNEREVRDFVLSSIHDAIVGITKNNAEWYHVEGGGYEIIARYYDKKPIICIRFIVESSGDIY